MDKLFPDSEGGWICDKHKQERGNQIYGSNCYRCVKAENERLKKLANYGRHKEDCNPKSWENECKCGFLKALRKANNV